MIRGNESSLSFSFLSSFIDHPPGMRFVFVSPHFILLFQAVCPPLPLCPLQPFTPSSHLSLAHAADDTIIVAHPPRLS